MRLSAWWLPLWGITAFPHRAAAQDKHPQSVITVTALPRSDALDRAAAALTASGYVVEDASSMSVTTSKRTFKNVWDLTLRVNAMPANDSTRVTLTGAYSVPTFRIIDEVVEGGHGGVKGKMWEQLSIAADSIRAALLTP